MKVPGLLIFLCTVCYTLPAQTDSLLIQSKKAEYLHKSKTRKTVAFAMLGVGTAAIVTGAIMAGNSNNALPYPIPRQMKKHTKGVR
jgi:hypothetical protein